MMQKIDQFNISISVIPNGSEKYMNFMINKNLVFTDSVQFGILAQKKYSKTYQTINLNICFKDFVESD